MRILFLTENFPPERNAAASRVYERACHWVAWGHEVTVVTCAPNFPDGEVFAGYENRWRQVETMDGMRVVRVKTYIARNEGFVRRTLDFVSFMVTGFTAGLFEPRPDVVVGTSPQFFTAVGAWALAVVRRVPFVFELSDLWPASIKAVGAMKQGVVLDLLERLELFLYRRAARVVALTNAFQADLVSRGIDQSKVTVVMNGVDLTRYSPRRADVALMGELGLRDCFVVGYVGTLGMAHGLENVLDAAANVADHPRIRFLFVGSGAARESLVREADRRGLRNVIFVPPQAKSRIAEYWALCDLALVHLRDDPVFETVIPSKMFEAMAMGLPLVLVAPEGEASAIIEEEGVGVWIPASRQDDLAEEVVSLESDSDRMARLAVRSLAAAPRHSRERQARRMLEVLEEVGG